MFVMRFQVASANDRTNATYNGISSSLHFQCGYIVNVLIGRDADAHFFFAVAFVGWFGVVLGKKSFVECLYVDEKARYYRRKNCNQKVHPNGDAALRFLVWNLVEFVNPNRFRLFSGGLNSIIGTGASTLFAVTAHKSS